MQAQFLCLSFHSGFYLIRSQRIWFTFVLILRPSLFLKLISPPHVASPPLYVSFSVPGCGSLPNLSGFFFLPEPDSSRPCEADEPKKKYTQSDNTLQNSMKCTSLTLPCSTFADFLKKNTLLTYFPFLTPLLCIPCLIKRKWLYNAAFIFCASSSSFT